MCTPELYQAAAIATSGAGNIMQSRTMHQNQMGRREADLEALRRTNERQRLLRSLESQRQGGMSEEQQAAFQRSLGAAQPEEIDRRQAEAQGNREDLMRDVMARSQADVPLPGSTIPGGGGGVMPPANRVVSENLAEDAESVGSARAALDAFPDAMGRISEALMPGQFNIGRIGQDSRISRQLLPGELDAARRSPRYPAPEGGMLGQLLQGLGQVGSMYAGMRAGQPNTVQGTGTQDFGTEFNQGPLTPAELQDFLPGASVGARSSTPFARPSFGGRGLFAPGG